MKIQARYYFEPDVLAISFYHENFTDAVKILNLKDDIILKIRLFNGEELNEDHIMVVKHSIENKACGYSFINIGKYNSSNNIELTAKKYLLKGYKVWSLLEILLKDPIIYIYITSISNITDGYIELIDNYGSHLKDKFEIVKVKELDELYAHSKLFIPFRYLEGEKFDFGKTENITKIFKDRIYNGNWYHYIDNGIEYYTHIGDTEIIEEIDSLIRPNVTETIRLLDIEEDIINREDIKNQCVETVLTVDDLSELINNIEELPQPSGFNGALRKYQIKGFSWLTFMCKYGLGICLADDMGLGKTIQIIALLLQTNKNKNLLVCPTSILGNWQRELKKFAPSLKFKVFHGYYRDKEGLLLDSEEYDIIMTTYQTVSIDEKIFSQIEWNGIIIDEAQNIKNYQTSRSKSIKELKSDYRIAITGTPIENRLEELWSIMQFLNPGYLGSLRIFKKRFVYPIETGSIKKDVKKIEIVEKNLKNILKPFILRRLKTDKSIVKELPEKIEMKIYCGLTNEQQSLYSKIVRDMIPKIDIINKTERKAHIFAIITRLKQVCDHPKLIEDIHPIQNSGKLQKITSMISEIVNKGNDGILVFTQFIRMGKILKDHLQKIFEQEVLFLHGNIPIKERENLILKFSSEDGPRIFISTIKAGGVGLNLVRANNVFHYDRWWNPAVENQATDRAFRIGQTKNVNVYKFICNGTFEERIDQIIDDKILLSEKFIDKGEGWISEMNTEQLKELFTLRYDLLGD